MSEHTMIELGERMLDAVKSHVARSLLSVADRLDDFERRLMAIPRGQKGEQGERGEKGERGEPGKDGPAGLVGKEGAAGRDGRDGRDGTDGFDGAPGIDALRLEVLDSIDLERSYPRSTYASHGGGLICSVRATDPVGGGDIFKAGWKIVVNGIAGIEFESIDERSAKIVLRTTSGARAEHLMRVPGVSHRGVWKSGAAYERGDLVTWGGSLWHCEAPTSAKPQEFNCDDWKLAVKKGRDGDNGKPGERGEQGPPGKPGRDFTNLGTPIT